MFQQLQFYQIGIIEYQKVVLGAPVTRFLCLVKLASSKHGHSTWCNLGSVLYQLSFLLGCFFGRKSTGIFLFSFVFWFETRHNEVFNSFPKFFTFLQVSFLSKN